MLRTDQVPELVEALRFVAGRTEELWASEGDDYAQNVVLRSSGQIPPMREAPQMNSSCAPSVSSMKSEALMMASTSS